MVTTYTVLKAVHVLAAVMWVGGNLALNVIGTRAANSGDGPRIVGFGRDAKWMGERLYLPASVIVLVFGILSVINGHWHFSDTWVIVGLAGVVLTALTGSLFLGPELGRIAELADQRGPDDDDVKHRVHRLVQISRIDLTVLSIVVVNMVLKPGA